MQNTVRKMLNASLLAGLLFLSLVQVAVAETTVYSIRVDGLACPYCAYGIEKKLNQLQGVKFINMDLDKGLVTVESYDVELDDAQLKQLFEDAGFTYRSKQARIK